MIWTKRYVSLYEITVMRDKKKLMYYYMIYEQLIIEKNHYYLISLYRYTKSLLMS